MRTHRDFLQPTSFDEEEQWEKEREQWSKRDLSDKEYVYLWADGIYFNVRLNDDRPCVLVIVGSLPDGTKELVTISDGERESKPQRFIKWPVRPSCSRRFLLRRPDCLRVSM